jgi:glycosyltransferase involved in cell wall biosynthesis
MELGELRGRLDRVDRQRITGWAQDSLDPERRVSLVVMINGAVVGRCLANMHRPDLAAAAIGSGRHGFCIDIPGGLSPAQSHLIAVLREVDGAMLPGAPVLLDALGTDDPGLQDRLASAVRATIDEAAENRLLDMLAAGMEGVLQRRAERERQGTAQAALQAFRENWAEHLAISDGPARAEPKPVKRALVVDDWLPDPSRDAGSVAALSHMQAMVALGYEVSLAAAQEMGGNKDDAARLAALGYHVLRAPYYPSVEDVLQRQRDGFDVVYIHRLSNAAKYSALVRHYLPQARLVYSVADLHHLRLARQAAAEGRLELAASSKQVKLQEMLQAWSADAVITHSPYEAALLKAGLPAAHIHVVPWAVTARPHAAGFAQRQGIAFIGSYTHAPNADAARFLTEAIMPLVHQADPDIVCSLIGSGMPDTMRQAAAPGVAVLGHVADLDAALAQIRLTVAPLRYGAGVKGKVLESFARGVPCVMSTVAAEGLALPQALAALTGDGAAAIADLILHLHRDEAAYAAARDAALEFIAQHHSAASILPAMQAALGG